MWELVDLLGLFLFTRGKILQQMDGMEVRSKYSVSRLSNPALVAVCRNLAQSDFLLHRAGIHIVRSNLDLNDQ